MTNRYRPIVDVHVILTRGREILLSQRLGAYGAGMWHLPSGHLDEGESVEQAAIREAEEEIGVRIDPGDLRFVHVLHNRRPGEEPRIGFVFETARWWGEPTIREPDKCAKLAWFPRDMLPENLIPYPAALLRGYLEGTPFATRGWTRG